MSDPLRRAVNLVARNHCNSKCCDCRARAPPLASLTYGIFLCAQCARIHEEIEQKMGEAANNGDGALQEQVASAEGEEESLHGIRSMMLSRWTPGGVQRMESMGNLRSNARYEASLTLDARIVPDASSEQRREFIVSKYVQKRWFKENEEEQGEEEVGTNVDTPSNSVIEATTTKLNRSVRRLPRMNRPPAPHAQLQGMAHVGSTAVSKEDLRRMKEREEAAEQARFDPRMALEEAKELAKRNYENAVDRANAAAAATASTASGSNNLIVQPVPPPLLPSPTLPPLNPWLTLIVTTSAVPSNPSLELIRRVIESCEEQLKFRSGVHPFLTRRNHKYDVGDDGDGSDSKRHHRRCLMIIVMDGYSPKPHNSSNAENPSATEDATHSSTPIGFVAPTSKYKNGRLHAGAIDAYEEYKRRLFNLAAEQPYDSFHLLPLELPFRHGFAGAVHRCMDLVATPYMMVMQHDWEFARRPGRPALKHSIWDLLATMEQQDEIQAKRVADGQSLSSTELHASTPEEVTLPLPINYITWQTAATIGYLEKDLHHAASSVGPLVHRLHEYEVPSYDLESDARLASHPTSRSPSSSISAASSSTSSPATPSAHPPPLPLVPSYFFFDRNHLVRSRFYRHRIFGCYRFMRSAAFIEDTFGQLQLNILRGGGTGAADAGKQYQGERRKKTFKQHCFDYYATFIYAPIINDAPKENETKDGQVAGVMSQHDIPLTADVTVPSPTYPSSPLPSEAASDPTSLVPSSSPSLCVSPSPPSVVASPCASSSSPSLSSSPSPSPSPSPSLSLSVSLSTPTYHHRLPILEHIHGRRFLTDAVRWKRVAGEKMKAEAKEKMKWRERRRRQEMEDSNVAAACNDGSTCSDDDNQQPEAEVAFGLDGLYASSPP